MPLDKPETSPQERLLHFDALVTYFKSISAEDAENTALQEVQIRSLDICEGDTTKLDENGLPINPRLFTALEDNIARFLRLNISWKTYAEARKPDPNIQGQRDPSQHVTSDNRGKLEDVMDPNHPIIGPYVQEFTTITDALGITTELTRHKHKIEDDQTRNVVLVSCFRIGRDLIGLIGKEKYNQVRQCIDLAMFQYFDADFFISQPPQEAAKKFVKKSHWNALPRVWIEELMILVANPELIERIIEKGFRYKKNVRQLIDRFRAQDTPKENPPKIPQKEYIAINLFKDPDIREKFAPIFKAVANLVLDPDTPESLPTIHPDSIDNLHAEMFSLKKIREVLECLSKNTEYPKELTVLLLELTLQISKLDQTYRKADIEVRDNSSMIAVNERMVSHAKDAATEIQWQNEVNNNQRITLGDMIYITEVNINRFGDVNTSVRGFNKHGRKIHFQGLAPENIEGEFTNNADLPNEHLPRVQELIEQTIQDAREKKRKADEQFVPATISPKGLLDMYKIVRYLHHMLQVVAEDEINEQIELIESERAESTREETQKQVEGLDVPDHPEHSS
ncbi:hypothetical protein ACFL3T_03910 [Patescibacteria group bacterium]